MKPLSPIFKYTIKTNTWELVGFFRNAPTLRRLLGQAAQTEYFYYYSGHASDMDSRVYSIDYGQGLAVSLKENEEGQWIECNPHDDPSE